MGGLLALADGGILQLEEPFELAALFADVGGARAIGLDLAEDVGTGGVVADEPARHDGAHVGPGGVAGGPQREARVLLAEVALQRGQELVASRRGAGIGARVDGDFGELVDGPAVAVDLGGAAGEGRGRADGDAQAREAGSVNGRHGRSLESLVL